MVGEDRTKSRRAAPPGLEMGRGTSKDREGVPAAGLFSDEGGGTPLLTGGRTSAQGSEG